ncbi:hypothetical protein AB0J13_11010 [Streptomyces anulatus]|uniref:hypothetical protein n=1 Tax=Streptomyces anulatus TaxID=1892 RepID=UPI0033E80B9D
MTDTTPASAADGRTTWPTAEPLQQAADLRRAAGDPLLADWLDATANALAWLAPYRDNEPGYGMWEAALAVARQLLGTTTTCGSRSLPTYSGNVVTCVLAAGHSGQCHSSTEWPYVSWPNPSHGVWNPDAAVPPAPADRAAVLRAEADRIDALAEATSPRLAAGITWATSELRRTAAAGVQPPTEGEELDGTALRRYARRMAALDRLCSGRPGYHTVTVKQVLTAMSDAADEQPAAPAAPEETQ